jgi:hypothetical protein
MPTVCRVYALGRQARARNGTYPDREHVERDDKNQKNRDPDGIVNALANFPAYVGRPVVVSKLDCIRNSNQLVACEDGVRKPVDPTDGKTNTAAQEPTGELHDWGVDGHQRCHLAQAADDRRNHWV